MCMYTLAHLLLPSPILPSPIPNEYPERAYQPVSSNAVFSISLVQLKMNVAESSDKITLSRVYGFTFSPNNETTHILDYKDENIGEFVCKKDGEEDRKIYVKCRTCDKCIKLDTSMAVGMVVGVLVATVLIGVAVYCIASQPKGTLTAGKKTSSKMGLMRPVSTKLLVHNEKITK
eukprot:XP_014017898.1 PREDICTED: T-cell surface glycoprotein CD3 delta chain-like [Salmo salar]